MIRSAKAEPVTFCDIHHSVNATRPVGIRAVVEHQVLRQVDMDAFGTDELMVLMPPRPSI
jgi:hypothetical protein